MTRIIRNMLGVTFIVDAIIAVGFGLYSWLFPQDTFGTIMSIPKMGSSAFVAILASLSLFYIVIGLTCLIGSKAEFPTSIWIGLLMLFRHVLEGGMKILDLGKEWFIGNPYPDIIIHSVFVLAYSLAVYFTYKNTIKVQKY